MKKTVFIFACIYFLLPSLYAQSDDNNNISIGDKTVSYEFVKGNNQNPVLIKEQMSTTFKCNEYRVEIPYAELYTNNSSIDEVKIYVNGDKAKYITPNYSYYSVDDYFYSDEHICYFKLPFEKKGTSSKVDLSETITDPRYFASIYFDEPYNIENERVTLIVPNWAKLDIKEWNFPKQGITKNVEQKNDATIYTYTIQNLKARKSYNNEAGPSYIDPHLLLLVKSAAPEGLSQITYFNSLQDQYNWYHKLVNEIGNDPSSFKDEVAGIVKDKKTDLDKIAAIYNWVQTNIRYIAFEDGIAGYKPEKAQEVYRKKYGDCKGMANLTTEMLKVAGLDARLCWLGTHHIAYDYSTPCLAVDNHMISAVKLNGKFIFLDATEKYIGFGEYAERIQGRQILIENGDQYILERIPVETAAQNLESKKEILRIDSGKIVGNVVINYKGESKEDMLEELYDITQQNRDNALQQYLSDNNNDYRVENIKTSDLFNWNKDLSIKYDVKSGIGFTEFGDEKYVDIDFKKEFASAKIDTSRQQDYWLPYKYNINTETELTLPPGFTVELPAPLSINNDEYSFNLKYSLSGNKLIYTKEILIHKPVIAVKQFSNWNADIIKLTNFYNEQITLKKS